MALHLTKVVRSIEPNDGYQQIARLFSAGISIGHLAPRESRNGPVFVLPGVCVVENTVPSRKVLLMEDRRANPFFHLMESLLLLGGYCDAPLFAKFNKRMLTYANKDGQMVGTYGHRWVNHFGFNQLTKILELLKKDPETRRAVLTMWDPQDLIKQGPDVPCNTQVYFQINEFGRLDMTVTNRSNDFVWGMFGANVVQFGMLHEYMSAMLGLAAGTYYQVTNNLHIYPDILKSIWGETWVTTLRQMSVEHEDLPYKSGQVHAIPLVKDPKTFTEELHHFIQNNIIEEPSQIHLYTNEFFSTVAMMLAILWKIFQEEGPEAALKELEYYRNSDPSRKSIDWLVAADLFLRERIKKNV